MSFVLEPDQELDYNWCVSQSLSRCVVHYNLDTEHPKVVTNTSHTKWNITCYKYERNGPRYTVYRGTM